MKREGWRTAAAALVAALCLWPGMDQTPLSGMAEAAPRAAEAAPDLLGPVLAGRYWAPVDTLADAPAMNLGDYSVERMFHSRGGVLMEARQRDGKLNATYRDIFLGISVPRPDNGGRICHGSLEVDGKPIASGANGYEAWISGRGLMRKTRFVTHSFEAPFTDEDEANARIQVVGRRAGSGDLKSLPACPTTAEIRRADIDAIDWRIHFQAYPATGLGALVPDCIRTQLDRMGAPASGRTADGAPSGRSVNPLSWRGRKVIEACRRWHLRRTDFACTLQYAQTRCEDLWVRSETYAKALDLVGMTDHLLSARNATVLARAEENGPMRAERKAREERAALAQRQEAERRAAELEARRRWEASPEGRAALAAQAERERKAEAQYAREFPYFVLIRCGDLSHINIAVCLNYEAETTLRLRNGGTETLYNLARIFTMQPGRETREGYRIDLRASHGLVIQNASPQIMGVRIYDRRTGRQVFAREVGRYGTIATAR